MFALSVLRAPLLQNEAFQIEPTAFPVLKAEFARQQVFITSLRANLVAPVRYATSLQLLIKSKTVLPDSTVLKTSLQALNMTTSARLAFTVSLGLLNQPRRTSNVHKVSIVLKVLMTTVNS